MGTLSISTCFSVRIEIATTVNRIRRRLEFKEGNALRGFWGFIWSIKLRCHAHAHPHATDLVVHTAVSGFIWSTCIKPRRHAPDHPHATDAVVYKASPGFIWSIKPQCHERDGRWNWKIKCSWEFGIFALLNAKLKLMYKERSAIFWRSAKPGFMIETRHSTSEKMGIWRCQKSANFFPRLLFVHLDVLLGCHG